MTISQFQNREAIFHAALNQDVPETSENLEDINLVGSS